MKKQGRPKIDEDKRDVNKTIRLSEKELKRATELANYLEIPITVFLRNLILVGLDDAEILKKAGVLGLAKGIKKSSEAIKTFKTNEAIEAIINAIKSTKQTQTF